MSSLLITDIARLFQVRPGDRVLRNPEMQTVPFLENAWLLLESGKIHSFGTMLGVPEFTGPRLSAQGGYVLPAWCDSHSHIVYAAPRDGEFLDRIQGLTYEEIAARGGGILNSARKLRETSEDTLFESALARLEEVAFLGTGALEIKSGYGLDPEAELKMLRVIRRLKAVSKVRIKATFLGAHAIPAEFRQDREAYLRLLIQDMLPRVAEEGLADYCDVFCDKGFFTPEETDRILEAAWKLGLKPKIHANELAISGGVQAGIRNRAISVDHLECMGREEIELLAKSETIGTALPGTSFFLGIPYADVREMLNAGVALALASDYNPGSTPSGRMPFVWSLACIRMRLTPEEALNAITVNGAHAMELGQELGSIHPGKTASLVVTKPAPSLAFFPYAYGSDWIEHVVLEGQLVR